MSSTIDATVIPSGTWAFDPTHSSVGFTVVYMGVAPFSGTFRSFEAGTITRDGNDVTVDGTLEIKGNRAPITLTGTITGPVADPWGNSKLGLSLEGSVDKNEVGLTWNAPLPEGGSMLGDEVDLKATLFFVQPGSES